MEQLFKFCNGYTPSTKINKFWNQGDIPWFRMEDIRNNGRILNKITASKFITKQAIKNNKLMPSDSFILSTTATIGEYALLTVDSWMNQRFTGLVINGLYKEKILVKFLFYYFPIISNFCKSHLNTSSFPSVDMNELKKFNIPIPPITLQQKVVDILDKFESLISSLTEGLPAEMKIRRQQYEYYRNKLLTFEKNEYV